MANVRAIKPSRRLPEVPRTRSIAASLSSSRRSRAAVVGNQQRWQKWKRSLAGPGRERTTAALGECPARLRFAHFPDDLVACPSQQGDHVRQALPVEVLGEGQALINLFLQ